MSTPEQEPLQAPVPDDLPPLTTTPLTSEKDKKEALHLITDSIAQQRQIASQSIILSPVFIAAWIGMLAILTKWKYQQLSDIGIIATTGSGITMALLLVVKWCCEGYVGHAETVAAKGLEQFEEWKTIGGKEEIVVLGTRYGGELIGSLVMRIPAKDTTAQSAFYESLPTVEIVAWTVKLRFRHKGIGRGLLEEAVKIARERCGKDVKVVFAKEHVHSKMVLMGPFTGVFRRREKKAVLMLKEVVAEARADDVADLI